MLAMKSILKSASALSSLAELDPVEWPTVSLLLERIKNDGMEKSYQGSILKDFTQSLQQKCAQVALHDRHLRK